MSFKSMWEPVRAPGRLHCRIKKKPGRQETASRLPNASGFGHVVLSGSRQDMRKQRGGYSEGAAAVGIWKAVGFGLYGSARVVCLVEDVGVDKLEPGVLRRDGPGTPVDREPDDVEPVIGALVEE